MHANNAYTLPGKCYKSGMNRPSLSHSFAFIATIVALSLIAILTVYETYLENSRREIREMETEATRIDRELIIDIEHSAHLVQGIGEEITHMNPDDLNGIAYLLRSFDTTATVHHVFSWIDADGRNVVSSNKGVHTPVDVSDRDFVKAANTTPWKIQIGNPIQGRVSGKYALPVAIGITDATGKFIGTVLISMDINTITRDLQKAIKESGIYFAIYSKGLLPLTPNTGEENVAAFDEYSIRLKSVDLTIHPSGVISRASIFNPNSTDVYYELSATYPYILMLGFDRAVSSKALHALLMPRLTEILLMGIFICILLWLVRMHIIQPIAELAYMTGNIVRGGHYHEPGNVRGVDELYLLTQQIKKLTEYLTESRRIEEENKHKNILLRTSKEASDLSNKIKIEFLISMSHALRIPLNTVIGFTEIIKNQTEGIGGNLQHRQYIFDIYESAKQLKVLADDMYKLSDAEMTMQTLQEKHIDVRFILSKCGRTAAKILSDYNFQVELKLQESMPRVIMDEQRLEQIIVNTIVTIVREPAATGHVIIRAYNEPDQAGNNTFCISFTDTGAAGETGTEAIRPKTPERYHPSHIGIPLTKALLAMHHTLLEVKSAAGKPDIITIRFPRERLIY